VADIARLNRTILFSSSDFPSSSKRYRQFFGRICLDQRGSGLSDLISNHSSLSVTLTDPSFAPSLMGAVIFLSTVNYAFKS